MNPVITLSDFTAEHGEDYVLANGVRYFRDGATATNSNMSTLMPPILSGDPGHVKRTIRNRIIWCKGNLKRAQSVFDCLKVVLTKQNEDAERGCAEAVTQSQTDELFAAKAERHRCYEMLCKVEAELEPPPRPEYVPPPVPAEKIAAAQASQSVIENIE